MAVATANETFGEVEGDIEDEGGEDNIRFITQVGRTWRGYILGFGKHTD